MKFGLVIVDYDGTLGDYDGIDKETVSAIKEYVRRGGKFAICTGRMFASIRNICIEHGLGGIVVSYQGAMINDVESGKLLFSGKIERELAAEVVSRFTDVQFKPAILSNEYLYYTNNSDYIEYYKRAGVVKLKKVDNLAKAILNDNVEVLKFNVICPEDKVKTITEEFGREYAGKLIVNSGGRGLVEFVNPKCSKGESVKFLSNYYNVPLERIMTVGDSTNDLELIKGEWYGVAVGDAKEELKKYAKEITVEFKNHPIKFLLDKYCL